VWIYKCRSFGTMKKLDPAGAAGFLISRKMGIKYPQVA
jgi:hypothetical protein